MRKQLGGHAASASEEGQCVSVAGKHVGSVETNTIRLTVKSKEQLVL